MVEIQVLTVGGTVRNGQLLVELKNFEKDSGLTVNFFHGVNGRTDLTDQFVGGLNLKNQLFLGRALSKSEIGCLISHHRIQSQPTLSEWTLVLEDDAQIVHWDELQMLLNGISSITFKVPTLIVLYHGNNGVVLNVPKVYSKIHLKRLLIPPTGAVAYLFNKKVVDLAKEIDFSAITGTADWPLWMHQVRFLTTDKSLVSFRSKLDSLAAASTSPEAASVTPDYLSSVRKRIIGFFDFELRDVYGGRANYLKMVIIRGLFFRLSRLILSKKIFVATEYDPGVQ